MRNGSVRVGDGVVKVERLVISISVRFGGRGERVLGWTTFWVEGRGRGARWGQR